MNYYGISWLFKEGNCHDDSRSNCSGLCKTGFVCLRDDRSDALDHDRRDNRRADWCAFDGPEMTRLALTAFEELQRRFPDGVYGRDALLKIDLARSHLAGKEMAVGRYYLQSGHYGAALRRFETVINDYQTTNQVPEALFRMTEAYLALGLIDEAGRIGSVASYNFPNSIWTERLAEIEANPERELPKGIFTRSMETLTSLFEN